MSGLVALALLSGACAPEAKTLPPFGEVRLAIDTDLSVPSWVGRVRIDLFDGRGAWIDTRDFATLEPTDFPLTFSIFTLDEATARDAFVRVRLYPEADLRPYRGERFAPRPSLPASQPVATTMDAACALAPELPLGARVRVTAPRQPQTGSGAEIVCGEVCGGAPAATGTGLAGARITIAQTGTYVIEASPPKGVQLAYDSLDPLLSVRRTCDDEASEIACSDNADAAFKCGAGTGSLAYGPRVETVLQAGTYTVLVGNRLAVPLSMELSVRPLGTDLPAPLDQLDEGAISGEPRLVQDGQDVTPALEPAPAVTVDRLVAVHVDPGKVRTARVLLTGECVGTMADLVGRRSCVDRENELVPVAPIATVEGRSRGETVVGKWAGYTRKPCGNSPSPGDPALHDGRACIEGGAFFLGDLGAIEFDDLSAAPRRAVVMTPFLLDTHEVTVARYRAALDRGFSPPDPPGVTEFEIEADSDCPLSLLSPHPERASFAMSCVSWYTARAFCRFEGGDLPTTAQREYAAAAVGRPAKSAFPWGDFDPACGTMAYARATDGTQGAVVCNQMGTRAVGVDAEPWASGDVTAAGIVGLGGNVREWLRDAHRAYDDVSWRAAPLRDPACAPDEASFYGIAGSSWRRSAKEARGANRQRLAPTQTLASDVGFRCVYAGEPGGTP